MFFYRPSPHNRSDFLRNFQNPRVITTTNLIFPLRNRNRFPDCSTSKLTSKSLSAPIATVHCEFKTRYFLKSRSCLRPPMQRILSSSEQISHPHRSCSAPRRFKILSHQNHFKLHIHNPKLELPFSSKWISRNRLLLDSLLSIPAIRIEFRARLKIGTLSLATQKYFVGIRLHRFTDPFRDCFEIISLKFQR